MARYKYLGEDVSQMGSGLCTVIRLKYKNGSTQVLTPIPPAMLFAVGSDIGYTITDSRALRQLDGDPRFERIS